MIRRLIGVSGSFDEKESKMFLNNNYATYLLKHGCVPVLLSPSMNEDEINETLQMIDGILLSGGVDFNPAIYHEAPHPRLGEVSKTRDIFELRLLRQAHQIRMPVLGICRGIQAMAVAMGGSLWQDIPSQLPSSVPHHKKDSETEAPYHLVNVNKESRLYFQLQTECINTNSYHHQAIKTCPDGFTASAFASDGLIEAIEANNPDWFCVGVQWHPERMPNDTSSVRLIDAFAKACITHSQSLKAH